MHPVFCEIGNLVIHTYGIMAVAGFFAAYLMASYLGKTEGLEKDIIPDLAVIALISAIIGARLFYVATEHEFYLDHPAEIIKFWKGGLVFYGGFLTAFFSGFIFLKFKSVSVLKTADVIAPGIALGHAFGRIGCFSAGCCYGKPSILPFAVTFTDKYSLAPLHIPLHPTQLYSAFLNFFLALFLIYFFFKKRKYQGEVFGLYLLIYGITRFIVESFRGDFRGSFFFYNTLSIAQVICLVLIISGIALLTLIRTNLIQGEVKNA